MKRLIFLITATVFFYSNIYSQSLITKSDSISISQDSIVNLVIPEYRGLIQWQKSIDGENWIELSGEHSDTLKVNPKDESLYRAMLIDGTCLPIYSDSAAVIVTEDTISTNIIATAGSGLMLISDSSEVTSGLYNYLSDSTVSAEIEVGRIIFDEESGGTIRKVTEVVQNGDTVSVKTEQATMEDLFFDTSFKLSTEMVVPTQDLKSATKEQISKALTDGDGFIHPVEVVYLSEEGHKLKSVSIYDKQLNNQGGALYMHYDWSGFTFYDFNGTITLPNKDGNIVSVSGNAKAYIDEGYFTYDPEFKFEFEFDRPKISLKDLEMSKGEITKFKFYSDQSLIEFKNVFATEQSVAFELGKKWSLFPNAPVKYRLKYLIGVVPLWIDFEFDFIAKLGATFSAGSLTKEGFHNKNYITLGAGYENKEWYTINGIEKEHEVITSNTVFGTSQLRFDLYPKVAVKLYSVVGPYFEVGPYASISKTKSVQLNWDKSLDLGVDARLGVSAGLLGYDLLDFSNSFNFFELNLWNSPNNLQLFLGGEQIGIIEQQLENDIIVYVYDNLGNKIEGVNVYFNPLQGTVSSDMSVSNSSGMASCSWTMSSSTGEHRMEIFVKNGKDEIIEDSKLIIKATAAQVPSEPIVETLNATDITETTAVLNGNVISDGNSTITERGFYWDETDKTPDSNDHIKIVSGTTGMYNAALTDLKPNTTYYYRAFAENGIDVTDGHVETFTTLEEETKSGTFTDSRDGHKYNWVQIGDQIWMAENLAYLPQVSPPTIESYTDFLYYVYGYMGTSVSEAKATSNYTEYGVLYNWPAAMKGEVSSNSVPSGVRGICPQGWHLPSDNEWEQLAQYISYTAGPYSKDGEDWNEIGNHLKSKNGWSGINGIDDFGFNGLPAGFRYTEGFFYYLEEAAGWWAATEDNSTGAEDEVLSGEDSMFYMDAHFKEVGFSVRCVKD